MLTYEYECTRCTRAFEVKQRISEPPLTICDRCGGPVRRLLSPAPFILKGGGWHVTDYPSEARKRAVGAESGAKDSAGSESKSPDPKSSTGASAPSSSSSSSSSGGASNTASSPTRTA